MKSKLHSELQEKARCYLLNKSYWITNVEVDCGYYGIYDVWGMKSEVGNFETMGIEVKISRADFKNNKYKEAKTEKRIDVAANRNYILCPTGLIQKDEVHREWGLLWFNGKRIRNVKKADFIEMTDKKKLAILIKFLCSKLNKNNP